LLMGKLVKVPVVDPDTCVGKGECVRNCPMQALKLVGGRAVLSDQKLCSQCKETTCEFSCPTGAITVKYQKV
jgi:NAD-dependent dihydropyrimidine dehydrogenase PreA subunit